jgi:hypothetical protein
MKGKKIWCQLIPIFIWFAGMPKLQAQWVTNQTPTYFEMMQHYHELDEKHAEIELYNMGNSDYGLPIYLCVINGAKDSLATFTKARKETTLLINNAIHAGEPDGVNACLKWIDDWIREGKQTKKLPVIAIIPGYNIGGMMNRNNQSRANQNGPEEYGFRGNAQNLDLNRDFIKMDALNSFTFSRIFHALQPDAFVDTHVSNGADYAYTLTYIANLPERQAPSMRELTYGRCIPFLSEKLKKKKWDLFPYVELKGETPDAGIYSFNDLPRYAMGYTGLFDVMSFTVETHMLKPFPERVQSTYDFIDVLISFLSENSQSLEMARKEAAAYRQQQKTFAFEYNLTEKKDSIWFRGYRHSFPKSPISGLPRLKYHPDSLYERWIPHYRTYEAKKEIAIPDFFIVGGQCRKLIEKLQANGVAYTTISRDTNMLLMEERILSYESLSKPYEGHFYHQKVTPSYENKRINLKKGDLMIPTDQNARIFLLSVLVAEAEDSYFRWNEFDSYLQQKEHFSAYVFEEKALDLLENNDPLREQLEIERSRNQEFKNSHNKQLEFIYEHSPYFEKSYSALPVYMAY